MYNTERFNVECNRNNFLATKTLLKDYTTRIEYPGCIDPSYWIFADVPVHLAKTIRDNIIAIKEEFRKEV